MNACQSNPGRCMGDPACGDRLCPGHPVQVQGHAHLQRQFRPDFGVSGPHFPTTRSGWGRVLITAACIAGAFFIAGALGARAGLF